MLVGCNERTNQYQSVVVEVSQDQEQSQDQPSPPDAPDEASDVPRPGDGCVVFPIDCDVFPGRGRGPRFCRED